MCGMTGVAWRQRQTSLNYGAVVARGIGGNEDQYENAISGAGSLSMA